MANDKEPPLQRGQIVLYADGDCFKVAVVIEEKNENILIDVNGKEEIIPKSSVDSLLTGGMVLEEVRSRTTFIVGPEELIV